MKLTLPPTTTWLLPLDGSSLTQISNQSTQDLLFNTHEKPTSSTAYSDTSATVAFDTNMDSTVAFDTNMDSIPATNPAPAPFATRLNIPFPPRRHVPIKPSYNIDDLSSLSQDFNPDDGSISSSFDPYAYETVDDFIRATFKPLGYQPSDDTSSSPKVQFVGWDAAIPPSVDAAFATWGPKIPDAIPTDNDTSSSDSSTNYDDSISTLTDVPIIGTHDTPPQLPPTTIWEIFNKSIRCRFKSRPPPDCQGTTDSVTDSASSHNSNLSLEDEVQQLVTGTSQKFVPKPDHDTVLLDAMLALRKFRTAVRSKEQRRLQRTNQEEHPSDSSSNSQSTSTGDTESIVDPPPDGLKTSLRPSQVCSNTTPGSPALESFLDDLETEVMNMAWNYGKDTHLDPISAAINNLQTRLNKSEDQVVVPTDKTNSFRVMPLDSYIAQVQTHLKAHGKKISHTDLTAISTEASHILEELYPYLAPGESGFLKQSIWSHAIPTPKLLIKDHKPRSPSNGEFPTRLICPANNFISAFPKLGYLGLKKIFEDNEIDYKSNTIIQASDLKTKLETLAITPANSTIISIDAQDYYPSVRFKLVKKAVTYFTRHLPKTVRHDINTCLRLIKFGMQSTYLQFQDDYYEYDGDQPPEDRGLTIGGYESAFLSDVAGAYIFKRTSPIFKDTLYHGTYRDDGIAIFNHRMTYEEIIQWQETFQNKVNELANGTYLQYTCELWADPTCQPYTPNQVSPKVTIHANPTFPYLDMEFHWYAQQALHFKVHLKTNQQLQYLNKGSAHTHACFRAIPTGVCHRLAKLTTITPENANIPLSQLYPQHFQALQQANLLTKHSLEKIPTLAEAQNLYQPVDPSKRALQQRQRDARRTTYFCIGKSMAWTTPIWLIIKKLKKKHHLKWLRVSMSYHRFTNLRELFNGDLTGKLNKHVISQDFSSRPCNCRSKNTTGCDYANLCRETLVVYRVQCKTTGKSYIGCTQQNFKKRMQQHFNDVRNLRAGKGHHDSYAHHFAKMSINFPNPSPKLLRSLATFHILWQGNPLSTVKTFGTNHCLLCDQERLHIFKWNKLHPDKLINNHDEIYGACKHKPKFHRFPPPALSSTDESSIDEKVPIHAEV